MARRTTTLTVTVPTALYDTLKGYAKAYEGNNLSCASTKLLERVLGQAVNSEMIFPIAVKQLRDSISVLEEKLNGQGIAQGEISSIQPLYELKPRLDELYLKIGEIQKHVSGIKEFVKLEIPSFLRGPDEP